MRNQSSVSTIVEFPGKSGHLRCFSNAHNCQTPYLKRQRSCCTTAYRSGCRLWNGNFSVSFLRAESNFAVPRKMFKPSWWLEKLGRRLRCDCQAARTAPFDTGGRLWEFWKVEQPCAVVHHKSRPNSQKFEKSVEYVGKLFIPHYPAVLSEETKTLPANACGIVRAKNEQVRSIFKTFETVMIKFNKEQEEYKEKAKNKIVEYLKISRFLKRRPRW